jgi:hypothetical protein
MARAAYLFVMTLLMAAAVFATKVASAAVLTVITRDPAGAFSG